MNKLRIITLLFVLCNLKPEAQIRIMPFGESTTNQGDSYRKKLSEILISYQVNFDFIGSIVGNKTGYDVDNQGMIGTPCSGLTTWMTSNYKQYPADIILLWEGTNDCHWATQGYSINKLSELIDTICNKQPNAELFVSTIPPIKVTASNNYVIAYNDSIPGLIKVKKAKNYKVHFVDSRGIISVYDMADDLHPSPYGYTKMSPVWFNAIRPLLNIVDVENVTLPNTAYYMNLNSNRQFIATITPNNASNKNVTWVSSQPNIAKITSLGKVFALATGTTTITATTVDLGKSVSCTVHVVDSSAMAINNPLEQADFKINFDRHNQKIYIHSNIQSSGTCSLISTHGLILKSKIFKNLSEPMEIDMSSLKLGAYIVSIQSDMGVFTGKILF